MASRILLIATRNRGKVAEFNTLLAGLDLDLRGLDSLVDPPTVAEDGDTYEANALAKAWTLAQFSGLPALADDSGLEVDALTGAPGLHSARFAGPDASDADRVGLLLQQLGGVPAAERTARFRAVLVVARPDGATLTAAGSCEGVIASAPRGTSGFGYDPIFVAPAFGKTFAELDQGIKNRISHRARACAILAPQLPSFLAAGG